MINLELLSDLILTKSQSMKMKLVTILNSFRLLSSAVVISAATLSSVTNAEDDGAITLSYRPPPPGASQCRDCHATKNNTYMLPAKNPVLRHAHIHLEHGTREMACGSCHDRNHSNDLINTPTAPASFENSSPVCRRCHVDIYRDWTNGMHGRRSGGWKGARTQSQCIDCHNPHQVVFPQMKAEPPPKKRKLAEPPIGH